MTAMYIFGWTQNTTGDTTRQLIDAYLYKGDHNFLVLDWSEYSVGLYSNVLVKISKISRMMGRALVRVFKNGFIDDNFHCVGHSFGGDFILMNLLVIKF